MAKGNILVVDDEPDILELVRFYLSREGYQVSCAMNGEEALTLESAESIDLVVLDVMLPGIDGMEVAARLKSDEHTKDIAVIMLSAKTDDESIVAGLEQGADDYVTKPFSPRILLSRVKAIIRRRKIPKKETPAIRFSELVIYPDRYEALINGKPLALTHTEFKILSLLTGRPGWVFSRPQIIEAIHDSGYCVNSRAIDVQIYSLRKKCGSMGKCIEAVRGIGYRMNDAPAKERPSH